jgi:uncharacterized protein (TIGR02996 family)
MAKAKAKGPDVWTQAHVYSLAPDDASITAAREVLRKGGFGTVEPTGDGRGWWVVCRGITDTYQVSARLNQTGAFDCACTCPSPKYPCKHALALLLYLLNHSELRAKAAAPKSTAGDFEGLLRAAFRDPDDDTPRLVFADFLEENDQPERAALIRYQCELARLKPQSKRARERRALIDPLVAKFLKRLEPLPEAITITEFHRGFLGLQIDFLLLGEEGSLPARFAELFRDGWVESVSCHAGNLAYCLTAGTELLVRVGTIDVSAVRVDDEVLISLAAGTGEARFNGRLARIKVHKNNQKAFDQLLRAQQGETVALTALKGALGPNRHHSRLTTYVFDLLLRTGQLAGATELALHGWLGDEDLAALLATDLGALRNLRLEGWNLSWDGVAALANDPALARVTALDLTTCRLGSDSVADLAAGTGLRGLDALLLQECSLTDKDVATLARAQGFPNLWYLGLALNGAVTVRGARAVLAAPHFPKLTTLNLSGTAVREPEQIALILDAPARPRLTVEFGPVNVERTIEGAEVTLTIGGNGDPRNNLFENFASCAGAKWVTQFVAPRVVGRSVAAVAAAFDPNKLWRLDLTDNALGAAGVTEFVAGFANFKLRELILRECRIGVGGLRALLGSPLFTSVRKLDLRENNLGAAGIAALLKVDVPSALEELALTDYGAGYGMGPTEKRQLRAKFGARLKW